METAGKLVDDDAIREAMKDRGLGTPATRAATIETLLRRNYISRSRKQLTATDLGRFLIATINDPNLKSPELTGEWEARLKQIEAGQLAAAEFMRGIVGYVQGIVSSADRKPVDDAGFGDCPRCGRPVIQGNRGYGCSGWKTGCSFVIWMTYRELTLTVPQVRELLQHRILSRPVTLADQGDVVLYLTESGAVVDVAVPTSGQQGSTKRGGSRGRRSPQRKTGGRSAGNSEGGIRTDGNRKRARRKPAKSTEVTSHTTGADDGSTSNASHPSGTESIGACPLCQSPVHEQKLSFGCSAWRTGCKLTIWKSIAGKRISIHMARSLLEKGETQELRGFKSKAGRPFNAKLKLVDGQVQFEFDNQGQA